MWKRRAEGRREQSGLRVGDQLLARIADVQIAHRQLADAVLRREHGLALFHGQALGLVGEIRADRVENRVIVAAPQLEDHLAGDRAGDPPLRLLAQQHRLRIEPAALIQVAPEPPAVVAILLDRVFVVDAGDQPLVGDEQQRHARRLVDAAALGFDDPILDLIAHAEAVTSADRVRFEDERHEIGRYVGPFSATGRPSSKRTVTVSGSIATSRRQNATPMIGSTIVHAGVEALEILGFVRRAEDVRVGRVRLLDAHAIGEARRAACIRTFPCGRPARR